MSSSLETFVASQPWFFLVGLEERSAKGGSVALRASPTRSLDRVTTLTGVEIKKAEKVPMGRFVAALRKRTTGKEQMISVGRMPGADILIPDDSISRVHAWFRIESGTVSITDMGSSNGTRVNGARIEPRTPTRVFPSNRIHLGNVELTLVSAHECWKLVRTPSERPAARK
ncbi:MAG: FHA domain-containing protein [Polyangiales bacterium]